MEACVQDAKAWLCDNGLVMNNNKSQAIVIHSSSLPTPTSLTRVNICGQLVETSPVIRFNVDTNLTMTSQVYNVCRSAYYHLSRIAKIRDSISTAVCKSLIHGLVTSRLDYGNAMLYGISDRGNGPAVWGTNCQANSAGRPAVHDNNTAAVTLVACQKANRF